MKAGTFLKYLIFVIVVVNVAIAAIVFLAPPRHKAAVLPNPNGFDDFLTASQMFTGDASGYQTNSHEQLAALVSKNTEALKTLRAGLAKQSRVPDDYSISNMNNVMNQLSALKKSIFFVCAEGRLAEMDGHTNAAANIYMDGMRFGEESSRDGNLISKLVGIACDAIALKPLESLPPSLDAKQCAEVARELEAIDTGIEPYSETLDEEEAWAWETQGIRGKFVELIDHKELETVRKKFILKFENDQIHRRSVMISFAARAYELDHGKRPASLADLVPSYLKAIPQDPTTGADLYYQP
jgi:hypothetical protein